MTVGKVFGFRKTRTSESNLYSELEKSQCGEAGFVAGKGGRTDSVGQVTLRPIG